VGIKSADGLVLAAEKRTVSKLLAPSKTSEKTATLDDHLCCLLAGLTSDANILINQLRVAAQRYLYTYQTPIPVEYAVKSICNYKQSYTQFGGLRPFGVAFLFAGFDDAYGWQLYQSDPSGNYSGWKATVIGQNNQAGKSILKTDYDEETCTIESNLKLAIKILLKTMDSATPSPERIEISSMKQEGDKIVHYVLPPDEVEKLITEMKAADEEESKKAEAASADI